jgi:hypothetical protein
MTMTLFRISDRQSAVVPAAIMALASPIALQTQTTGKGALKGTIPDPAGAVIPNASVTVTNHASSVTATKVPPVAKDKVLRSRGYHQ